MNEQAGHPESQNLGLKLLTPFTGWCSVEQVYKARHFSFCFIFTDSTNKPKAPAGKVPRIHASEKMKISTGIIVWALLAQIIHFKSHSAQFSPTYKTSKEQTRCSCKHPSLPPFAPDQQISSTPWTFPLKRHCHSRDLTFSVSWRNLGYSIILFCYSYSLKPGLSNVTLLVRGILFTNLVVLA